jgi:hypothetical protein
MAITAAAGVRQPMLAEQTPGLRIVVVEGEDAVNVIQQKTAVAPVVEVRDRNDQPVAGAVVNFAVRSGRATFGGARTLNVTTNAAGRAVAAGFTPTGTGALQIGATATFQGQAAAAVTIAQTTVQTVAQAAAVAGATSAGSGAGGGASAGAGAGAGGGSGGGLSATTVGIVSGAAVGGIVVAKELGLFTKVYAGRFVGVLPATSAFSRCTQFEQQTGTIEMTLDDNDGAITGNASIEGNLAITPGTCVPNAYNTSSTDTFGLDRGNVGGTAQNLTFTANASNNYSSTDGGGVNSYDFAFTGTFDGAQVTGALTVTRTVTFRSATSPFTDVVTGSVTHNVTLR